MSPAVHCIEILFRSSIEWELVSHADNAFTDHKLCQTLPSSFENNFGTTRSFVSTELHEYIDSRGKFGIHLTHVVLESSSHHEFIFMLWSTMEISHRVSENSTHGNYSGKTGIQTRKWNMRFPFENCSRMFGISFRDFANSLRKLSNHSSTDSAKRRLRMRAFTILKASIFVDAKIFVTFV